MVRSILQEQGLPTPERAVTVLAGSQLSSLVSRQILGHLKTTALFPFKVVFRRLFLVLWVKDCVDMASVTPEVASLADRLAAALWEQRGYFLALEQRYQEHLDMLSVPAA